MVEMEERLVWQVTVRLAVHLTSAQSARRVAPVAQVVTFTLEGCLAG